MSPLSRLFPLLLAVALILTGCSRPGSGSVAPSPGPSEGSAVSSASVSQPEAPPEPPEENTPSEGGESLPTSSDALPIEQRSDAYAPLLEGFWTTADGSAIYCFRSNGSGTVSWLEEEELQAFDWSVLRDESGMDVLYLFFDGTDAAARYLPVFDEGLLDLCDPESFESLMSLTYTSAEG